MTIDGGATRGSGLHNNWVAAAACMCAFATPATQAEPFLTRNQSPLLALYGLPSPLPARLPAPGTGHAAGVINWSNFAATESKGGESYTLDGEVFETRLRLVHAVGDRYAMYGELAWRSLDEGTLDGIIDDWHGIFGLPNGSRDRLPEDQLLLQINSGSATLLHVDEGSSGLADIPLALGYQVLANEQTAIATWVSVKIPAGSAEDLTGSEAVDVAASIAASSQLATKWQLFGQADLTWLGEGELMPDRQQDYAWSALAGATWNAWRGLDLTVQLAANSAVFERVPDDVEGDAVVLTFGWSYRTQGGWRFDVGVSEDIVVSASPDVAFNFAVQRGF